MLPHLQMIRSHRLSRCRFPVKVKGLRGQGLERSRDHGSGGPLRPRSASAARKPAAVSAAGREREQGGINRDAAPSLHACNGLQAWFMSKVVPRTRRPRIYHDLRNENFVKPYASAHRKRPRSLSPSLSCRIVVVMPTTNEATPISRFARGLAVKDNCLAVLLQRIKTRAPI
jgi:hypothetical protein